MAISLGQIDLEALKNYLKIVQGFRTIEDPSGDTELVDGISSKKIAIAALDEAGNLLIQQEDENGNQIGRTVVNNALNLVRMNQEGQIEFIKASDVLTMSEGEELKDNALAASQHTAEDMRALRNEMYHLKLDMIKSGSVQYDNVYNGYIDPFISMMSEQVYEVAPVMLEGIDGNIPVASGDTIQLYQAGQYVMLTGDGIVAGLDKLLNDSGSLTLEKAQYTRQPDQMRKTFGMYHNGKFVFASDGTTTVDTGNVMNMIYKDGAERVSIVELNESISQKGFVSTIIIPAELDNTYLKTISLSLRVEGAPGVCYCELYDYATLDKSQNRIFGEPIASSKNLSSANVSTNNFSTQQFVFDNEILLEKGHMYVLVLKANGTSTGNIWRVGGFPEQCNNTIHQDTYVYMTDGTLTPQTVDILSNQVTDMFIGLGVSQIETNNLSYSKQGIYTGVFEIENDLASRVRVSFNPDLNGKKIPNNHKEVGADEFNINDFYKVSVIGRTRDMQYVQGIPDALDANNNHMFKVYSHRVLADGRLSANEYVYDFHFGGQQVDYIEFQIVYDSKEAVGESGHGALYAVVVSTDNAFLGEEV